MKAVDSTRRDNVGCPEAVQQKLGLQCSITPVGIMFMGITLASTSHSATAKRRKDARGAIAKYGRKHLVPRGNWCSSKVLQKGMG